MMNDPLASVLSNVLNSEKSGHRLVKSKPVSKTIQQVLGKMTELKYLGEVTVENDGRGGTLNINLIGNINKCGAIKPRHAVHKEGFEKFEKRFLPAKDFGVLIVSTPQGVMTHTEAKKKGIGGRLLAYCY
jgi:small subunit ribosomal protein S8